MVGEALEDEFDIGALPLGDVAGVEDAGVEDAGVEDAQDCSLEVGGVEDAGEEGDEKGNDNSSSSSSSSSSSDDSAGDSRSAEFDVGNVGAPWVEIEPGLFVKSEEYTPKHRPMYRRWKARCSHHGGKCSKFRSCAKQMCMLFGDVELVAYLSCWHDMGEECHVCVLFGFSHHDC